MSTSSNTDPWNYAKPAEPKTDLWWTLGVLIVLILGVVLWGPTTANLPPMMATVVIGFGIFATFMMVCISFDSADGVGFLIALLCAAIGIGMPIMWGISAHNKQNVSFSATAIEKVAETNGGRIAFSTGVVHGASKRAGAYVSDEGHFHGLNKYNRETPLEDAHVRGWGVKEFETRILDKYFSAAKRETIASGKMTCQKVGSGILCAQRRANGQYYKGTYTINPDTE